MNEETPPSVERFFEAPLRQHGLSTGKRCFLLGVPSWKKLTRKSTSLRSTNRFMVPYGILYNDKYSRSAHPHIPIASLYVS